jgi:hypothetical protein
MGNAIIGVDLGFKGGITYARQEPDGTRYHSIVGMPVVMVGKKTQYNTQYINDLIVSWSHLAHDGLVAVIEDVWARPGEGVVSSFRFGRGRGIMEGLLTALQIPYSYVSPQKWKKAMGLVKDKDETKAEFKTRSRLLAMELAPEHANSFKRASSDGLAESFLLTEYMFSIADKQLATANTP